MPEQVKEPRDEAQHSILECQRVADEFRERMTQKLENSALSPQEKKAIDEFVFAAAVLSDTGMTLFRDLLVLLDEWREKTKSFGGRPLSHASSTLKTSQFDPGTQTLTIEFKSGGKYSYVGVPTEEYQKMCLAESSGELLCPVHQTQVSIRETVVKEHCDD